jgi:hypothetical protein
MITPSHVPERKESWDNVKAANEARAKEAYKQRRLLGTPLDGAAAAPGTTSEEAPGATSEARPPTPRRSRAASPAQRLFGAATPAKEDVAAVAVKADGGAPYLMEVLETDAKGHHAEISSVVETSERLLSQIYYRQNMYGCWDH